MAYVGWSSVANQVNTTTGAALEVNGQVTSSLYFGAGVGGEGATNLMLAPSLNLNFALFGQDTLDPRINFSRTTNATVTNSAGLITYAPMNLLTYSEQFDNAAGWSKTNITVTANTIVAPNGTITAETITNNVAGNNYVRNRQTVTTIVGNPYAYSCYFKSGNINYAHLLVSDGTDKTAIFNLSNGTAVTLSAGITASITSVGDGWYRCVAVVLSSAATSTVITLGPAGNGVLNSNLNDFIYAWGAQLEIGSTATTYNSTTVKNLLGYSELFDNAAWTKSNSFVQTNLITFSEAFDNAAWTKAYSTVTADTTLAPNGYQTADTLFETAITQYHGIYRAVTVTNAIAYTLSVNMKPAGRNWARLTLQGTTEIGAYFDLVNGVLGTVDAGVTATITPATNGFYKCSVSRVTDNVSTYVNIYVTTNNNVTSYAGDITKGMYLWGAQLVQGSVAGDYRRTDAAALPVYYPNHNGVVCAEKLVENTVNSEHRTFNTIITAPGTYTYSVYLKAAERSFAQVKHLSVSPEPSIIVNLATGAITSPLNVTNYGTENVGNGYWRVWMTYTTTTTTTSYTQVGLYSNAGSGTYTGDGTSGIYIFGAQLSDSASLDPYVLNAAAAPTAAAYYGARFDYDPVTLAPKGLLIEEQRANLVTYSEDFRNTADAGSTRPWTYNGIMLSNNAVISPDGTLDADKIVETAITDYHGTYQSVTTSGVLTYSAYFKAAERNYAILFISSVASGNAIFDLVNGTVNLTTGVRVSSATINPVGNGWYRCSITSPTLASAAYFPVVGSSDGTASYLGEVTKGVFVWGAQLEAGAFATSYIPTAASQVTRAADVATIQGSNFYSWYNQNEGSVYSNHINTVVGGHIYDIGESNTIRVVDIFNVNLSTSAFANYKTSDSQQTGFGNYQSSNNKIATSYAFNNYGFVANNSTLITDTATNNIQLANTMFIGSYANSQQLNGTIKQISYYPQRLSDSVLKGLTA